MDYNFFIDKHKSSNTALHPPVKKMHLKYYFQKISEHEMIGLSSSCQPFSYKHIMIGCHFGNQKPEVTGTS